MGQRSRDAVLLFKAILLGSKNVVDSQYGAGNMVPTAKEVTGRRYFPKGWCRAVEYVAPC
jgi:hypothetical protein